MNKLQEIVEFKKTELTQIKTHTPLSGLEKALKSRPPVRPFRESVHRKDQLSLIAEVKRASPSAGTLRAGADAVDLAGQYARAGAQAISVLTDQKFFSGSLEDLKRVKEAVSLPILRKDFLLEEYHVIEAAAAGADCILLIVAILEPKILARLLHFAKDLSLEALVEVHSEKELKIALDCDAPLVGINNRNLDSLKVDLKVTKALKPQVPGDRTVISESGMRSRSDVQFIEQQGVQAVLIGEAFMSSENLERQVKELMGRD